MGNGKREQYLKNQEWAGEERDRLAGDLGPTSKAMILRNHGLLSVGQTVSEAFEIMYYLDTACQIQVDAVAAGADQLQMIGETTAGKGYQQFQDEGGAEIDLCWKAMLRMLDRKGISYRV